MSKHKLTEEQRETCVKAYQKGTSHVDIAERFNCDKKIIARTLINAGVMKGPEAWSDEAVSELKELVKDQKLTVSMIAGNLNQKFNTNYSKEAVSGKLFRLGLSNKKKKAEPKEIKPRTRVYSPVRVKKPSVALPESEVDNTGSLNVSLVDLEPCMCKWPVAENAYCGLATSGHRVSYCAKHQKAGRVEPIPYRGVLGARTIADRSRWGLRRPNQLRR